MDGQDPRAGLIYDAAVRALDQQAAVVESVRVRAGILLSAASVATAFLAGVALDRGRALTPWGWAAVLAFLFVGASSLWLLLPRHEWQFAPSATTLVVDYLDPEDVTLARAQRNLAIHMGEAGASNAVKLKKMFRWFEAACAMLGVEVLLWIIDLAWRS